MLRNKQLEDTVNLMDKRIKRNTAFNQADFKARLEGELVHSSVGRLPINIFQYVNSFAVNHAHLEDLGHN